MPFTLPVGIPATTCLLGGVAAPRTDVPAGAIIDVRLFIDRPVIHVASGTRFDTPRKGLPIPTAAAGVGISFAVPPVDASGFLDAATAEPVTGWSYRLAGVFRWADAVDGSEQTVRIDKTFQPLTAPSTLDLNTVPDNAEALPETIAPRPPVTSVAGLGPGTIDADDLRAALGLALVSTWLGLVGTEADADWFKVPVVADDGSVALAKITRDSFAPEAAASTSVAGVVRFATTAQTVTGDADDVVVTPAGLTARINALIGAAPGALDTLVELAAALGNDANYAATVTNALAAKQPLDADLTAIAALVTTVFGRDFLTLVDAAAARTKLGLGSAATQAASAFEPAGAVAAEVTARNAAISTAISNLIGAAPGALDTLVELAAALGNDANFATTVTNALAGKQPLDATLSALSGLSTTPFGRGLLALADAAGLSSLIVNLDPAIAIPLLPYKRVRVWHSTNVTITNPGTSTFDGVVCNTGDRIGLYGQTASAENGLYTFNGPTVPMTRTPDGDTAAKLAGAIVIPSEGTGGSYARRINLKSSDTLGVTSFVVPRVNDTSVVIGVSQGGTGSSTTPSAGANVYAVSGTSLGYSAVGTTGDALISGGTGAPTWANLGVRRVRACATGNVTISNPGTAVFDGVTLNVGDEVLLRNQTVGAENGPYRFNGSAAAMTRATWADTAAKVAWTRILVTEGTNAVGVYDTSNFTASMVLGTNTVNYAPMPNYNRPLATNLGGTATVTGPAVGEVLVGRSGSVYAPQKGYPVPWAASTAYKAYQPVQLPTGGLGYSTADRTSGAAWDATERAAWTFVPGNHLEVLTASGTWTAPTGITQITVLDLLGGGAGGNGGGSINTATAGQAGGTGGASGERKIFRSIAVAPGTSYTTVVGAGGTGGAGGAAGGNPGVQGNHGGLTSLAVGATTYIADGGKRGSVTPANFTSTVNAAFPAQAWAVGLGLIPGQGGLATSTFGQPTTPLEGVWPGGGGSASTTTNGGTGGDAKVDLSNATASRSQGGSATASGTNGTTATIPGCGGGGGGGGANTGAGGNGGAGARGEIVIEF